MRIVAGRFRRRVLKSPPGRTTRPITDRAKEILFERLGGTLDGERVADVFAGTGTLGLEALSRGASTVLFVERDRRAHQLLQQNVDSLGVADVTFCWRTDVLRTSFRPRNAEHLRPFDLVFFDPPYADIRNARPGTPLYESLRRLARQGISAAGATLLLRTPARSAPRLPDCWEPVKVWTISTMEFHVFRRRPFEPYEAGHAAEEDRAEAPPESRPPESHHADEEDPP